MKETLSERKTGAIYIRVSTDKQEELSQKVDYLESQLAGMTKERDILKAQLDLLKEIMQPMSISQNNAQKSDKKTA